MKDIGVVVVTYNRSNCLELCLNGLAKQTLRPSKVYIIDNASTDQTQELAKSFCHKNDHFQYIRLSSNEGGSGGFFEGMKKAFEAQHEWIWVMDDDVYPSDNCLEVMMSYSNHSFCIQPTEIHSENDTIFNSNGFLNPLTGYRHRRPYQEVEDKKFVNLNYACFEGFLIHRSIIEKVGFPDKRFFMNGDDLIYGFLVSRYTSILYLNEAKLIKQIYKIQKSHFLGLTTDFQNPVHLYFNARSHFLKNFYFLQSGVSNKAILYLSTLLKFIKLYIQVLFFFRTKSHHIRFFQGLYDGITSNWLGHKRFIK